MKKYLIVLIILVLVLGSFFFYWKQSKRGMIDSGQVACTMEAKICPDGKTYVGRQGPKCEFEKCPDVIPVIDNKPVDNITKVNVSGKIISSDSLLVGQEFILFVSGNLPTGSNVADIPGSYRNYLIIWGDGGLEERDCGVKTPVFGHVYNRPGTYNIEVRVDRRKNCSDPDSSFGPVSEQNFTAIVK